MMTKTKESHRGRGSFATVTKREPSAAGGTQRRPQHLLVETVGEAATTDQQQMLMSVYTPLPPRIPLTSEKKGDRRKIAMRRNMRKSTTVQVKNQAPPDIQAFSSELDSSREEDYNLQPQVRRENGRKTGNEDADVTAMWTKGAPIISIGHDKSDSVGIFLKNKKMY